MHSSGIPTKRCIVVFILNPYAFLNGGFVVQSLKGKLYQKLDYTFFKNCLIECSVPERTKEKKAERERNERVDPPSF